MEKMKIWIGNAKIFSNKFFLGLMALFLLCLGIWIGSSSRDSTDQSAAIDYVCTEVENNDYNAVAYDFMIIARHNPGFLKAAYGAKVWATYKGDLVQAYSGLINDNGKTVESVEDFFTLCPKVKVK